MPQPPDAEPPKILVVEDSFLIAEEICYELEAEGCEVVGPTARIDKAMALAESAHIDGAVLDLNLDGAFSFALAEKLKAQRVPFVFVTGYADENILPWGLRAAPRFTKPFVPAKFRAAVSTYFRGGGSA